MKIDRSFVADILQSDNDAVIVNATINLAHNLGFQVTAEGVESNEVLNVLEEYGCDLVQGFYVAKPLPIDDFDRWMKESSWRPQRLATNGSSNRLPTDVQTTV